MKRIHIFIFSVLFTFSCKTDGHDEVDAVNRAYIVPIERKDISPKNDSLKRLPTLREFEQLFLFASLSIDCAAVYPIGEAGIRLPLQGYSPSEGTVVLYHTLGSYLAQGDSIFQFNDKAEYQFLPYCGGYHSLRYVSDSLCDDGLPFGGLYWFDHNEGEESEVVSYFNQNLQSVIYRSLYLVD